MAAAAGVAIAGAKPRHNHLTGSALVDQAFRLAETPDLTYANPGSSKQVIDVPVHLLSRRQMPADTRLEVTQGAPRVDVAPCRKNEFAKPPDTHADRIGDVDQQLVGSQCLRTSRRRTGC